MLTTYNNQVLESFPSLNGGNSTTWHTVNLELSIPYAFITHYTEHEAASMFRTTVFWIEGDIIKFFRNLHEGKKAKIDNIALLLSLQCEEVCFERRWVPLDEIWRVPNCDSKDARLVYLSAKKEWIGGTEGIKIDSTSAELVYRVR